MTPPEKRLPGQSKADYEGRGNPNVEFFGTRSLDGGGDPSWVIRAFRALFAWRDRQRGSA